MQLAVVILLSTTATASTTCTTQVLPLENLVRVSLPDLTSGKISWDGSLPTMVKIDSSTKEWRALTNAWSKEQFVHDFGSTLVDTATPYDVAMYGPSQFTDHTSRPQTLRHLLNEEDDDARNNDGARNDDLMIFAGEHTRLTQLVLAEDLPAKIWIDSDDGIRPLLESVVKKVVVGRTFISIAKVGQGLPFHRHGKTFTTLVSGTKRWLVAPPSAVPTPDMVWTSSTDAYCERKNVTAGTTEVRSIAQVAGELLYLPNGWWHATSTPQMMQREEESSSENIALAIVRNVVEDDITDTTEEEEENEKEKEKEETILLTPSPSQIPYAKTMEKMSENNWRDISQFDESREAFYYNIELKKIDATLQRSDLNRSESARHRWSERTSLYDKQYERARKVYETMKEGQRTPALCLYVVQVMVARIINDMTSMIELQDKVKDGGSKDEERGGVAAAAATATATAATAQKAVEEVLSTVLECSRAVEIATKVDERMGTAARSSSLILLAQSIRIHNVLRRLPEKCYQEDAKQQSQWTVVPPLDMMARSFRREAMRLLVKATTETRGNAPSVKSLWELASVTCGEEEQGEDVEREKEREELCRPRLESVLLACSDHGAAKSLWWLNFPESDVPKRASKRALKRKRNDKKKKIESRGGEMEKKQTDSGGGDGDGDGDNGSSGSSSGGSCRHENLLALIHDEYDVLTSEKDLVTTIRKPLAACLDYLSSSSTSSTSSSIYDWLNARHPETGQTSVMKASLEGDADLVRLLCGKKEVDLTVGENYGYHAYDGAAFNGRPEALLVLLKECPRSNEKILPWDQPSAADGYTPLWRAVWGASHGHSEAVKVLLESGANPNFLCDVACPGPYKTMMEYAISMESIETIGVLMDGGAKVTEEAREKLESLVRSTEDSDEKKVRMEQLLERAIGVMGGGDELSEGSEASWEEDEEDGEGDWTEDDEMEFEVDGSGAFLEE